METRSVIVIGGAMAGYTAALYLARATLKPLVIAGSHAGGQLMYTTLVENYPGFSQGVQGPKLMEEIKKQVEKFGAEVILEDVSRVDFAGEVKKVWVGEKQYQAKAIILATGAMSRMLNMGEEKLLGRGVSTCAVCDAAFYKDKTVFVVGGGDAAMEDALALLKFTDKVTIVHRGDSFRASQIMQDRVKEKNIAVMWNSELIGVEEKEGKLSAIKVKGGSETKILPADGLFLAIGHVPATKFLLSQVELDSHEYLLTNMTMNKPVNNQEIWLNDYPTQTSVKGVFGAGDMVDIRYRQAITAAGMGCMAALDAERFLTGSTSSW